MDKETIIKLITTTPSPPVKLVMEGRHSPYFILDGTVESIQEDSLIFKSRTMTGAVSFSKIIEIVIIAGRKL